MDPDIKQIENCKLAGVDLIEINTGKYAEAGDETVQKSALEKVSETAKYGHDLGLEIHAGHGLDYRNIRPVAALPEIEDFSIGFAIVARAAIVGIKQAVQEIPFDQFPGDLLYPWGDERGSIARLVEIMTDHDTEHRDEIVKAISAKKS